MIEFRLRINLDNDAFYDEKNSFDRHLLALLLARVAADVGDDLDYSSNILDANGNTCGEWELIEED